MAELIADMGAHLNGAGIGDLSNTSSTVPHIHLGLLRDQPNRVIALIQLPGSPPLDTFAPGAPPITRPRLQVFVRHDEEDYQSAETVARAVWTSLSSIANQTINGSWYQRVFPVHEPTVFDRDDQDRVVFVCNYEITRNHP